MKAKPVHEKSYDKETPIVAYSIKCLGCGCTHEIPIVEGTHYSKAKWGFNNNLEKPTFTPSLHIRTGKYADPNYIDPVDWPNASKVCHSFITDGKIQYLGDCTHEYVNKTIELPDID